MSRVVSDPTANKAVGSVDRQLRYMAKEAKRIGQLYRAGRLSSEQLERERRRFTGIFRRLLDQELSQ